MLQKSGKLTGWYVKYPTIIYGVLSTIQTVVGWEWDFWTINNIFPTLRAKIPDDLGVSVLTRWGRIPWVFFFIPKILAIYKQTHWSDHHWSQQTLPTGHPSVGWWLGFNHLTQFHIVKAQKSWSLKEQNQSNHPEPSGNDFQCLTCAYYFSIGLAQPPTRNVFFPKTCFFNPQLSKQKFSHTNPQSQKENRHLRPKRSACCPLRYQKTQWAGKRFKGIFFVGYFNPNGLK